MTELFYLKNNLESYLERIWLVVIGFITLLLGTMAVQPYKWIWFVLGIFSLLFGLMFLSKRFSYIKFENSTLFYKESFFHKVISIDCKSINHLDVSNKYFVINTNDKKYEIYHANIREYEAINVFPDFINKLKLIVKK